MPRPSPTALAMARYALSKTDSLSLSRTARDRPAIGRALTGWAAARLSACCSRRSMLKSSSRMDSSLSHGAACATRPKARRNAGLNMVCSVNNGSAGRGHERSEEHTSELQSRLHLVCRLLLEKKKQTSNLFRDEVHRS